MVYTETRLKYVRKKKRYGNTRNYNGLFYDSVLEANYAEELDHRIDIGELSSWERQIKLELKVYDDYICNYFIDFKEYHPDGSITYTEVKGIKTQMWLFKWRLTCATWGHIDGVEKFASLQIIK